MTLVQNWKRIITKAWSIRWMLVAALFAGIDAALPIFANRIPQGVFSILAALSACIGTVARILDQPDLERRATDRPTDEEFKAGND
ncbi:MAG: hypothetical protein IPM06_17120 [Rhizobiales bacterium]|nr:hypothetical protein [Hyphomicrobiales bacterium]